MQSLLEVKSVQDIHDIVEGAIIIDLGNDPKKLKSGIENWEELPGWIQKICGKVADRVRWPSSSQMTLFKGKKAIANFDITIIDEDNNKFIINQGKSKDNKFWTSREN